MRVGVSCAKHARFCNAAVQMWLGWMDKPGGAHVEIVVELSYPVVCTVTLLHGIPDTGGW